MGSAPQAAGKVGALMNDPHMIAKTCTRTRVCHICFVTRRRVKTSCAYSVPALHTLSTLISTCLPAITVYPSPPHSYVHRGLDHKFSRVSGQAQDFSVERPGRRRGMQPWLTNSRDGLVLILCCLGCGPLRPLWDDLIYLSFQVSLADPRQCRVKAAQTRTACPG